MKNLGQKLSNNKFLIIPAVIGLLIVPSIVVARNNTNQSRNESEQIELEDDISSSSDMVNEAEEMNDDSSSQYESDDSSDDSQSQAVQGSVSVDEAKSIAQNVFPDKTIEKVETENEDGVLVYSVRFTDSSRVDVSSSDGSVVRTEQEEDHEDEDQKPEVEIDEDSNED